MKKSYEDPKKAGLKGWFRLPPDADLRVDPEALRRARQGVPKGELHG